LVDFNMDEGEEIPYPQDRIDEALRWLLNHELISMEWDPDLEEMIFFMTEEQKKTPFPNDWEETP